jgi:Glycosyl transferase family 2
MADTPITVVIPTRERCDVLVKALQTVTSQDYDPLEIIVSDNASTDRTREVVAEARDPRIRYLNTGRRLSMSHNWEFALSHVRGGWVTMMGDDDGLLPGALKRLADLIAESGARAIRSDTCYYAWPSLTGDGYGYGSLRVPLRSGYEVRNGLAWLEKVLWGEARYTDLPMLYGGGFVDFSVLQELRAATGAFYRSCIPDVYMAFAIASLVDTYIYLREPLAINGASKHSTGTSMLSPAAASKTSPIRQFASEGNIPFHADVPLPNGVYPASLQVVVYECFLQTTDLRQGTPPIDHARELTVILGSAGRHTESVHEWGKIFAQQHALDFESIVQRASEWRARRRIRRLSARLAAAMDIYKASSSDFSLGDVFEASIASAAIRAAPPGRVRNVLRGLRKPRRLEAERRQ